MGFIYPNLFPFCIQEGGEITSWDQPLSLEEAMQLYWLVKTWSVQASGDLYYKPPSSIYYISTGVTNTVQTGAQTLDGKICFSNGVGAGCNIDLTLYSDLFPDGIPVGGRLGFGVSLYSNKLHQIGNLYYANIEVGGDYGNNPLGNIYTGASVGNYTISFFDKTFNGTLRARDDYVASGNIQLTISASSYFSY
jgi:hypothetical protein